MILVDTMPSMDTLMERQQLVGWIVRDRILDQGIAYTEAGRRWPMAMATLNRLMLTGNVGLRFYATAERGLGLPPGLFRLVVDGNIDAINKMDGLDKQLREYIVRELGGPAPAPQRARRAARKA